MKVTPETEFVRKRVLDLLEATQMKDKPLETAIGLSQGTIKNWRSQNGVSLDGIIKVAKHFDITSDYILGLNEVQTAPASWFVFKHKIFNKGNKTLEELASELKQPLSFFTDWELGVEPDERTLWAICNIYGLKSDAFEKTKKVVPTERTNNDILAIEDIKLMLSENNGIDWIEKLYKELQEKQKIFVLTWLIGYMVSEGLPVKQILGK